MTHVPSNEAYTPSPIEPRREPGPAAIGKRAYYIPGANPEHPGDPSEALSFPCLVTNILYDTILEEYNGGMVDVVLDDGRYVAHVWWGHPDLGMIRAGYGYVLDFDPFEGHSVEVFSAEVQANIDKAQEEHREQGIL